MDAPRWERLSRLFDAALDLPEAQQEAYIVENCTDDAELVGALRRMLAADAEAASGDFLETPMAALPPERNSPHLCRGRFRHRFCVCRGLRHQLVDYSDEYRVDG